MLVVTVVVDGFVNINVVFNSVVNSEVVTVELSVDNTVDAVVVINVEGESVVEVA